jgi:hypothetical protein
MGASYYKHSFDDVIADCSKSTSVGRKDNDFKAPGNLGRHNRSIVDDSFKLSEIFSVKRLAELSIMLGLYRWFWLHSDE